MAVTRNWNLIVDISANPVNFSSMNNISYDTKWANRLAAKIVAQNAANALANFWQPKVRAMLEKWVGQKVQLVTGGKPVKLKAELDALNLPHDFKNQVIVSFGTYSVKIDCKVFASVNGENATMEAVAYLGDMDGLYLKDLRYAHEALRVDFSVDEVKQNRANYEAARKAFEAARSKLAPFGEHDNF